ncbi:hypothetical protein B0T11DRAFT_300533 [Plectosphaerella cucumerina]|uniref:CFEM domain-containing protein n=1 Tax=Plectosphaerella cucumerina TaxID=40658 RepID=A0A8K0T7P7_9PEZI|nr:hypothetical protein B0T11DRAFT_300533 [Plectosphaerella cucumerina]
MKATVSSVIIALAFGMVSCQTTTSPSAAATSLPDLVSQVPTCILGCLPKVGEEIGCSPTDFECICSDSGSFVAHLARCMVSNSESCGSKDAEDGTTLFDPICNAVRASPAPAAVASASSIVSAAIAEASEAAASPTPTNAAMAMSISHGGILGAIAALLLV